MAKKTIKKVSEISESEKGLKIVLEKLKESGFSSKSPEVLGVLAQLKKEQGTNNPK